MASSLFPLYIFPHLGSDEFPVTAIATDQRSTTIYRLDNIYNLVRHTFTIMFKEIVSLAIILGFILNIIYVAHPNTTSYTIAFVLSLIALSPFLLLWRYWDVLRNRVRKLRSRHQKVDDVEAVGLMSGGPDGESCAESGVDFEKGLGAGAGKAPNSEET
jgi:hypothetical protein